MFVVQHFQFSCYIGFVLLSTCYCFCFRSVSLFCYWRVFVFLLVVVVAVFVFYWFCRIAYSVLFVAIAG